MTRIADFCRGVLGLALIIILLVGVPTLLLVIVGFPLPTERPSLDLIRANVEDGTVPDLFLVKALALVAWVVWAQLAVAIVAEFLALVRGRVAGRAPVMPAIQGFAGKLVASTVFLVSAFTSPRGATAAPLVPLAAATIDAEPGDVPALAAMVPDASPPPPAVVDRAGPGDPVDGSAARIYATRPGDNWWDLAERLLGDGLRWSELRSLNSGRTMLDGAVVTERTESVRSGWHLLVPADADPGLLEEAPLARSRAVVDDRPGLARLLRPGTLVFEGPTGAATGDRGVAYQVVAGDNLWDIAERHLGDPLRWPEIYERSTDLRQTFGRRITDPNLIWPDSILSLPADAIDVPAPDPDLVAEVVGDRSRLLRPEDLARAEARATEEAERGTLRQADGAAGDVERRVEAPVSPPAGPSPGDGGDGDRGGGKAPAPTGPGPDTRPANDVTGDTGAPIGPAAAVGGGAVLATTGLLGLLRRARRLRQSEMGEGSVPAPPPMQLIDVETVLRNGADGRRAAELWRAIDSLSSGVRRPDEPVAPPEVVRVGPTRVEAVLLGEDARPPTPWQPVAVTTPGGATGAGGDGPPFPAGRTVVAAEIDALSIADQAGTGDGIPPGVAAPTLVTVGVGLLVNLEGVGVLAVDGPPEAVTGLIRSLVTELVTGPARRTIDIRLSDRLAGAELLPHGRHGSMAGLEGELASWLENAELALAATGASSPYALRAAGSPGALPGPVVVFANGTDDGDLTALTPLVERARRRALPLAVVVVGVPGAGSLSPGSTLWLQENEAHLEPHGIVATAQSLDLDLVLGAGALIDHARRAPIVSRPEPTWVASPDPAFELGADLDTDPAQVATEETPEHEVDTELPVEEEEVTDRSDETRPGLLIRVLGPLTVEGGPPDLSDEQRSVLAFLALAGPSTSRQVGEAVWPGRRHGPGPEARAEAALADLRAGLGPLLPPAGDGRHRLRSTVTDLGSALRLIGQARAMSGDRARNLLQLALADVRGAPFEGVAERHWQWIEDHRMAVVTQASSMLMDACFDLCDQAYEADDLHLARWACDVAALIDPLQETVVTRRVQLLRLLDEPNLARDIVTRWEDAFADVAGRPAPRGPRLALEQELAAPHVG